MTTLTNIPHNLSLCYNPKNIQFALKSNNVVLENHIEPVEAIIFVQGGKIAEIICPQNIDPAELAMIIRDWDIRYYGNLFILPGLIDSNVHLHADFDNEWNNIEYATALAATGGVTTIIDNPLMCKPFLSGFEYVTSLKERIENIKQRSKIDFGVFGLLETKTEAHIHDILEIGALGLKCYMISAFQNTIDHCPPEKMIVRQLK